MSEYEQLKAFCAGSNLSFISRVADAFLEGATHEADVYVTPQIGIVSQICSELMITSNAGVFEEAMVRDLGRLSRLLEFSVGFFERTKAQEILCGIRDIQEKIAVVTKTGMPALPVTSSGRSASLQWRMLLNV